MFLPRHLLLAGTAIVMIGSAASADSNSALIDQTGDGNSADIAQPGDSNIFGSTGRPHDQLGDFNELIVRQRGDGNSIGAGLDPLSSGNRGFRQRNDVDGSDAANFARLVQNSDGNTIGTILQRTRTGGAADSGNRLRIVQGSGNDNTILRVRQVRNGDEGNTAVLSQSGRANVLDTVVQIGQGSRRNRIEASFSGNENGRERQVAGVGSEASGLGAFSGQPVGVTVNALRQDGAGNRMSLDVAGRWNRLGATQIGNGNDVGTLTVTGDNNDIGIGQLGNRNTVSVGMIGGNRNDIGVSQIGIAHTATINVSGNANAFYVDQNGASNIVDLDITGDGNGAVSGGPLPVGPLYWGLVQQTGADNEIDHDVLSGEDNAFAFGQLGATNSITGTQDGTGNAASVYQVGVSNSATFNQIGAANSLGIVQ